MGNNVRLVRIIFGKDKIQIIESTKIRGGSWEKITTNELSVAKVFHKVLNKGRVEEIFEKSDYEVLGKMLYEILTANKEVKDFFEGLIDRSTKSDEIRYKVMLQFEGDTHELAGLPWEYLLVPVKSRDSFFYLSSGDRRQFDVIRDFDLKTDNDINLVTAAKQLNVIWIFVGARRHENEPSLNYEKCEQVFETLRKRNTVHSSAGDSSFSKFNYFRIIDPTRDNLKKRIGDIIELIEGPYVLHFLGHAEMKKNEGPFIGLASGGDLVDWVKASFFIDFFRKGHHALKLPDLVIMQACESAQINEQGEGIGIGLVRQGIPAVVAMQNEITLDVSLAFVRQLYTHVLAGEDLAYAITECRYYLGCKYPKDDVNPDHHYGSNAFGTPVLFSCVGEEQIQLIEKGVQSQPEQESNKICKVCSFKYKADFFSDYCIRPNCRGSLISSLDAEPKSGPSVPSEESPARPNFTNAGNPQNARLNEAGKV